jgi:hypothetical protein
MTLDEHIRLANQDRQRLKSFRFVNVKRYKRSIGRRCLHCNHSATVTADRKYRNGTRMPVRYCNDCADTIIQGGTT